jgi:RimJ/RimL family protein N-acetyltransferase
MMNGVEMSKSEKSQYLLSRITSDQYRDENWQEYFEFNKECSELLKTEFRISTWEKLKEISLQYLDSGLGIYIVKKNGEAAGSFYFEKYFESHPELQLIYLWSYLGNNILDVEIIKLVLQAFLEFHPDHGFLVISSVNGLHDYLGEILHAEIVADQTHYEITKEYANRELIEEWLGTYSSRFPNLKMKFYEDIPDELIEEYCRVTAELRFDIPTNSEVADYHITPDTLRLDQEDDRKNQRTSYRYLIFNEENRLIAQTKVAIDKKDPKIMIHHMTGVIKPYRGLGLSKWLKGAIYKKVELDFPEFGKITTHTHSDNLRLKSVSLQMGYKQTKTLKEYKVTREKAEAFIKG